MSIKNYSLLLVLFLIAPISSANTYIITPSDDTYTASVAGGGDNNYGDHNNCKVGTGAASNKFVCLLKFNNTIPYNQEIINATLQTYVMGSGTSGYADAVQVWSQLNNSWNESNATATNFSNNYENGTLLNSSVISSTGVVNFSVTDHIASVVAGNASNISFEMRPATYTNNFMTNFTTKENSTSGYIVQLIVYTQNRSVIPFKMTFNNLTLANLTANTTYPVMTIEMVLGNTINPGGEITFGVPWQFKAGTVSIWTNGTATLTPSWDTNSWEKLARIAVSDSSLVRGNVVRLFMYNFTTQEFDQKESTLLFLDYIQRPRYTGRYKISSGSTTTILSSSEKYLVNITSNSTSQIVVTVPSIVQIGTSATLAVVAFDRDFNIPYPSYTGTINFTSSDPLASIPGNFTYGIDNESVHEFTMTFNTLGFQTVSVTNANGTFESNTVNVVSGAPDFLLYACDDHSHTQDSDGMIEPITEFYKGAFNYSRMDCAASSDHDAMSDTNWSRQQITDAAWNLDGKRVTIPAYEYTETVPTINHMIFYFLGYNQTKLSADNYTIATAQQYYIDNKNDTVVIAHFVHSGNPSDDLWQVFLREIYSKWSDESAEAFYYLNQGYKYGFEAGGDSNIGAGRQVIQDLGDENEKFGYTMIWARNLTRKGIFEAMKERRTVATTGERIYVNASINGDMIGSVIYASTVNISVSVAGTNNLTNVSIIRNGTIIYNYTTANRTASFNYIDSTFSGEKWYVVQVTQQGKGVNSNTVDRAWTSPMWVSDIYAGRPVIYLASSIRGYAGNSIGLSSSGSNISLSGSALAGGVDGSSAYASSRNSVMAGYKIFGFTFIIIGMTGCLTSLLTLAGRFGGVKRR